MNTFIDELREYAERNHLSQKEVASRLNVPYKTVQSWFAKGRSHYDPSPANRDRIKKLLYPETQPTLGVVKVSSGSAESSATSKDQTGGAHMTSAVTATRGKTVRDPIHMDVELTPPRWLSVLGLVLSWSTEI